MNDYDRARLVAQALLKGEQTPTRQIIQEQVKIAVDSITTSQQGHAVEVDEEKLVRELESLFNTRMGVGTILENKEGHLPWLADLNSEIHWDFWNRYVRYLEEEKGWAPATTQGLDQLTDSILERLENPLRSGAWDRRGMVVGQVQSGKTANYIGLICKAVDAGYKLIIVLAGIQNSLRSQTQLRLDEGFLGYDSQLHRASTQENSAIGVGLIPVGKRLIADSATNSANNGDFNKRVAGQFGVAAGGGNPLLFVVKKNTTVLKNLLQWAFRHGEKDEKSGKRIVRGVPLLVIDDEADNASINTNTPLFDENGTVQEEYDVSAINGSIRKLLDSFEKSAYLGYTATPFANIFISPDIDKKNPEFGDDLFPRSFIINLPAPSNYIGPVQVFGLETDSAIGLEASKSLPIIRSVDDQKEWMPDKHKKDHVTGELPESLKEAIRAFILCCSARIARGQESEHNSMLVHVTRFTAVQSEVAKQVKKELTLLQKQLRSGDSNAPKLEEEFEQLWKDDFVPTTSSILSSIPDPKITSVFWEEVKPLLHRAASKIQIKKINGTAKDVLDYWEHKNGLSVIAIGGDKLSRGLTLEGLSVSYYLRSSKMYDTLMQMGRWFGYRPGYLDLCRLYTTDELIEWYEHITVASEELRQEFDYMAEAGETPDKFGLKVRTHPQGLVITGANKMRTGTVMQLSYTRSLSETTLFYKDENKNQQNLEVTEELLISLGSYTRQEKHNYIWAKVPPEKVIEFLSGYQSHDNCKLANTSYLVKYIEAQIPHNELTSWTVVLISNNRAQNKINLAGNEVGLTWRKDASPESSQKYRLSRSRLLSPTDEWIDLSEKTRNEILEITQRRRAETGKQPSSSKTPDGKILRSNRSPKNGLLLLYPLDPEPIHSEIPVIGFVMSFPNSDTAEMVEYKVNNVYWQEEFGQP
ncbi:Z1 domain-containing protein [Oscillatoria sp. HE19RPO]|uniref:Z1 domain-containing protein n=1 Tax=Oscillatoria sp. HE19RPO TaxID=2954806 RepID=UPI0020C44514|nr:Z1 domain-containing protein [Oscillatoria sp. HE19RPO]